MVIDYRNLNAKTKTYNYPIPNKILKIRQIQGYNYFSKFDCKSGFYHLRLEEESKQLTAFTVPQGFYEDKWEKLKTPMVVTGFNNEGSMIKYKAKNIKIQIWDKILIIEEIYNFEFTTKDMLLGMPFLDKFYPP